MLKKIIALVLCVALVFAFAACGKKDNSSNPTSSDTTTSDPTQDFDSDKWDEGAGLTSSEREELEDLWGELSSNLSSSGAEIQVPSNSSDSGTASGSNGNDTTENDNISSESSSSTNDSTTNNEMDGTQAELSSSIPSLW